MSTRKETPAIENALVTQRAAAVPREERGAPAAPVHSAAAGRFSGPVAGDEKFPKHAGTPEELM